MSPHVGIKNRYGDKCWHLSCPQNTHVKHCKEPALWSPRQPSTLFLFSLLQLNASTTRGTEILEEELGSIFTAVCTISLVNEVLSACLVVLQLSVPLVLFSLIFLPPLPAQLNICLTFYCCSTSMKTNDLCYNCLLGQQEQNELHPPPPHTKCT